MEDIEIGMLNRDGMYEFEEENDGGSSVARLQLHIFHRICSKK